MSIARARGGGGRNRLPSRRRNREPRPAVAVSVRRVTAAGASRRRGRVLTSARRGATGRRTGGNRFSQARSGEPPPEMRRFFPSCRRGRAGPIPKCGSRFRYLPLLGTAAGPCECLRRWTASTGIGGPIHRNTQPASNRRQSLNDGTEPWIIIRLVNLHPTRDRLRFAARCPESPTGQRRVFDREEVVRLRRQEGPPAGRSRRRQAWEWERWCGRYRSAPKFVAAIWKSTPGPPPKQINAEMRGGSGATAPATVPLRPPATRSMVRVPDLGS
jgi:hypothetical protein